MIVKNQVELYNDFKLVTVLKTKKAFSFFNYIFLGEKISDEDKRKIIKHEIVHSRQKHSLDLLLFEFLKIVMWFNPLVYIFQMRIAEVHEFISDSYVIKTTHKEQYINTLLNELFEVDSFSFVNQFAKKSILKTRIMMMTKQKSKQLMQAKYLLLLPLFAGMLFYISCSEEYQNFEYAAKGQEQKMYIYGLNGLEQMTRPGSKSKKSYLDFLIAFSITDLPDGWKEITENDLTNTELQEYEEVMKDYEKLDLKSTSSGMEFDYKLFRDENQRGVLGMIPKFDFEKTNSSSRDNNSEWKIEKSEGVPFSIIDKIPTFPGCDENDKKCFNKRMREHFFNTFDKDLPNKLGLSSGKKRMIMLFVIGSDGVVKSIRAKAPHKALEEEAIRVLNSLPKMIPGENNGEAWSVRYTLPIRIDIQ